MMLFQSFIRFLKITNNTDKLSKVFQLSRHRNKLIKNVYSSGIITQSEELLHRRYYSRYSANTIMSDGGIFSLEDYNIIGLDLDNTLVCYNNSEIINLGYSTLAKYLVQFKNYPKDILKPIENDFDFLQKGLFVDTDRGNIFKISNDGTILKASHGTKFLTADEIIEIYGPEKSWDIISKFVEDPLLTWNGPDSNKMRSFLDYFDTPVALLFARSIDVIDKKNPSFKTSNSYRVWEDILEGLIHIFRRESFADGTSEYFEAIKAEPEKYVVKTDQKVINWLKELKKTKATFLLTGSDTDFCDFVSSYGLGKDWKNLFDVVITYARKPGFFTECHNFYEVINMKEAKKINDLEDLKLNNLYSQGNWTDLQKLLKQKTNMKNPRSLYIGDNLVQDIYTPSKHANNCDTISVIGELLQEQLQENSTKSKIEHKVNCENGESQRIFSLTKWGSYFGVSNKPTIWTDIILNHSKICIPDINYLADKPIDFKYDCLKSDCINLKGFYPSEPVVLHDVDL